MTTQDTINELNMELNSNIADGLEKIKLDDLIKKFANEKGIATITITGLTSAISKFDPAGEKQYCTFTFAEDTERYSTGAGDFPKLYNKLMNLNENNQSKLNALLAKTPLKVQIWKTKTKSNGTYTKVKAIEFVNAEADPCAETADDNPSRDEPEPEADVSDPKEVYDNHVQFDDKNNPFDLF